MGFHGMRVWGSVGCLWCSVGVLCIYMGFHGMMFCGVLGMVFCECSLYGVPCFVWGSMG